MSNTIDQNISLSLEDLPEFRITFNLPAVNYFFELDGSGHAIVQIKIENGEAFLRSVSTLEENCTSLSSRCRGGCEAVITGQMSHVLLAVLRQTATPSRPFYTLHRVSTTSRRASDQGWLSIQHFNEDGAPPKFSPHMRVWIRDAVVKVPHHINVSDDISNMMGDIVNVVRDAKQKTLDYASTRAVGRPPKEITEARQLLDGFKSLVLEIFPELTAPYNLDAVKEAHKLMTDFLKTVDKQIATEDRLAA